MYKIREFVANGMQLYTYKNEDTLAVENLLTSNLSYTERVYRFEDYIRQLPSVKSEPEHEFIDGMCRRKVVFEKGTLVTGKLHTKPHMDVMLEGEMLIATPEGFKHLIAPCTMTTLAGTKKAGIALERTVWTSYHPTNVTNGEDLEKEISCDDRYIGGIVCQ